MTRYYFDLSDGGWEPDTTGTELADDRAAEREAIRFAGEVMRDQPERLGEGPMRVEVRADGTTRRFAVEMALIRVDG